MRIFSLLLLLLAMASVLPVRAQGLFSRRGSAVNGNGFYVSPSAINYEPLTQQITAGATTDYERTRLIYLWLTKHISYDTSSDIRTADACYEQRRGVCQGYCELFYRLAQPLKLDVHILYGVARAPGQVVGRQHAWLSVKTERGRILLDPTWGAGSVQGGAFVRSFDPLCWFDVDPTWFVFTHLPKRRRHQHLQTPVTDEQFARLPYATQRLSQLGWQPAEALQTALDAAVTFPRVEPSATLQFVDVPRLDTLRVGIPCRFVVTKRSPCRLILKEDNNTITESQWTTDGTSLTLLFTPRRKGLLHLMVEEPQGGFALTRTAVSYNVR